MASHHQVCYIPRLCLGATHLEQAQFNLRYQSATAHAEHPLQHVMQESFSLRDHPKARIQFVDCQVRKQYKKCDGAALSALKESTHNGAPCFNLGFNIETWWQSAWVIDS